MIWGMLLSHQMSASNDKLIFRGRCVRERNGTFRDDVVIRWGGRRGGDAIVEFPRRSQNFRVSHPTTPRTKILQSHLKQPSCRRVIGT